VRAYRGHRSKRAPPSKRARNSMLRLRCSATSEPIAPQSRCRNKRRCRQSRGAARAATFEPSARFILSKVRNPIVLQRPISALASKPGMSCRCSAQYAECAIEARVAYAHRSSAPSVGDRTRCIDRQGGCSVPASACGDQWRQARRTHRSRLVLPSNDHFAMR